MNWHVMKKKKLRLWIFCLDFCDVFGGKLPEAIHTYQENEIQETINMHVFVELGHVPEIVRNNSNTIDHHSLGSSHDKEHYA
jgi:hypothetical protein